MSFITVTSYIKDDNYTTGDGGLLVKDRMKEIDALINMDQVIFIFASQNGTAGSMLRFINGVTLDVKETPQEIDELVNPPIDPNIFGKFMGMPEEDTDHE